MSASEEESQGPIIRDRRRIDPVTGQPRQPQSAAAGGGQSSRGAGPGRPGKHSASKPGGLRPEAAGPGQTDAQNGAQTDANGAAKADGQSADLAVKLAERTADLQRVQA